MMEARNSLGSRSELILRRSANSSLSRGAPHEKSKRQTMDKSGDLHLQPPTLCSNHQPLTHGLKMFCKYCS